jgi:acylphosphatase
MGNKICIRYRVSGRVQGVYFRAHTTEVARGLGLGGWVRNLHNGQVEVLASGDEAALGRLKEWLRQGPRLAEVTSVHSEPAPFEEFDGFSIRRDS